MRCESIEEVEQVAHVSQVVSGMGFVAGPERIPHSLGHDRGGKSGEVAVHEGDDPVRVRHSEQPVPVQLLRDELDQSLDVVVAEPRTGA